MSAPRPHVTDPFHPLGSILNMEQFLYICKIVPVISSKWYVQVCLGVVCLTTAHALLKKKNHLKLHSHLKSHFVFSTVDPVGVRAQNVRNRCLFFI